MSFCIIDAKKLKDDQEDLRLFLSDGFEIDEGEILLSGVTENRILVIALDNEFASGKLRIFISTYGKRSNTDY